MVKTPAQTDTERAINVALKMLSLRARSRHEIDMALIRRGFDETERKEALSRLVSLGYVDDERFARDRAEALLRSTRVGPQAVLQRLQAHGLSPEQARQALNAARGELQFDEVDAAQRLLRKRRIPVPTADPRARARAARFLGSRGFSEQVIVKLLGEPLDSESKDD